MRSLLSGVLCMSASALFAQPRGLGDPAPATRLAQTPIDTEAFAVGRDFRHYPTIRHCLGMARLAQFGFRHSLAVQDAGAEASVGQSIVYLGEEDHGMTGLGRDWVADTNGLGATVPLARACGARFTLAQTDGMREWNELFMLALFMQADSLAQAVLATQLAHTPSAAVRTALWTNALKSFLGYGRVAAAQALVAQADAFGPAMRDVQMALHAELGQVPMTTPADTARNRAEWEHVLQLVAGAPHTLENINAELHAFRGLMQMTEWGSPDSVTALAMRAKRAISRYFDTPAITSVWNKDWPHFSVEQAIEELADEWYTTLRVGKGIMAPRLPVDFWFPPPGQPVSDTVRPVPGKVNIVCQGGKLESTTDLIGNRELFDFSAASSLSAQIRRWLSTYGAARLAVTVVWGAVGFTNLELQEEANYVHPFPTPAAEAAAWRWYTQDYEQLPVTVAVEVRQSTWRPHPDGRRLHVDYLPFSRWWLQDLFTNEIASNDSLHGAGDGSQGPGCAVVARDGTIAGTFRLQDGRAVDAVLRWLFREPGARLAIPADTIHSSPASTASAALVPRKRNAGDAP